METRLDLRLIQKLIMTPQLQQAIRLLQLNRMELETLVNQALMENPVLEETQLESGEEDGASTQEPRESQDESLSPLDRLRPSWEDYFDEEHSDGRDLGYFPEPQEDLPSYEQTLSRPSNLAEHLLWQLRLTTFDPKEREIGEGIIGNLDENGYLRATVEEIAQLTRATPEQVERVLRMVQEFDPVGVAARDVRECLLIQMRVLGLEGSLAWQIVAHHLEDFERRRFESLARTLGVSLEDLAAAIQVIEGLEPKPGRSFYTPDNPYIIPDVYVFKHEGEYVVTLNEEGIPRLRISNTYRRLLQEGLGDQERRYLEERLRSALWLIKSIEQRNQTIYKVAKSIVKFQREFLDRGIQYLRPLTLRQVAEDIQMHESTVSRVTTGKYMCTPQGTYEMKFFFNSGLARTNGEACSSVAVREMIRKLVAEEDPRNPYSDQQIVEYLRRHNIEVARRTVAKYRKELKIPAASQRRQMI